MSTSYAHPFLLISDFSFDISKKYNGGTPNLYNRKSSFYQKLRRGAAAQCRTIIINPIEAARNRFVIITRICQFWNMWPYNRSLSLSLCFVYFFRNEIFKKPSSNAICRAPDLYAEFMYCATESDKLASNPFEMLSLRHSSCFSSSFPEIQKKERWGGLVLTISGGMRSDISDSRSAPVDNVWSG